MRKAPGGHGFQKQVLGYMRRNAGIYIESGGQGQRDLETTKKKFMI